MCGKSSFELSSTLAPVRVSAFANAFANVTVTEDDGAAGCENKEFGKHDWFVDLWKREGEREWKCERGREERRRKEKNE